MKNFKIVIPVVLVIMVMFSWFNIIKKQVDNNYMYDDCLKAAQTSLEEQLYEQTIEFYKEAITYKKDKSLYNNMKEVYDKYYDEEHTPYVRNCYITDMEKAILDYNETDYWLAIVRLYEDSQDYSNAYKTVKKAMNNGVKTDEIIALNKKYLYMVRLDYKLYFDFNTALNGFISVNEGNNWTVIDENGKNIKSTYENIGLLDDDGSGLFVKNEQTRYLDKKEVTRAKINIVFEETGCYSTKAGYVPVKVNNKWKYINLDGEFLDGEYEYAGSFCNNKAAIKKNDKWSIIDNENNIILDSKFEDIKLDLYNDYLQSGIVIAKENGKYHLYNDSFEQIGDFECDDIDICIDDSLIAFKQGDKWGYVDKNGKIIVEPKFAKAKSFSNKLAPVGNDDGLWGYINKDYEVVIDYQYADAFYFNSSETAFISQKEGEYQLLHFKF